jgi:hypothetical protein
MESATKRVRLVQTITTIDCLSCFFAHLSLKRAIAYSGFSDWEKSGAVKCSKLCDRVKAYLHALVLIQC